MFLRLYHVYLWQVFYKRDLFIWQKRPIYMAKETYLYGKRDLLIFLRLYHVYLWQVFCSPQNMHISFYTGYAHLCPHSTSLSLQNTHGSPNPHTHRS